MKNHEISGLFRRMGALLEIKNENVFRVRSYFKAADNIENCAEDIAVLRADGRLGEIPGIGKTLEEKIGEYLDTGRIAAYQKLTLEIPESILAVMDIPSVGPKKAGLFFHQLGVKDIAGLEKAARSGKLLGLEGIKEKTVQKILDGIKIVRQGQERMNLGAATNLADSIVKELKKLPQVRDIVPAGSLRRCKETVRDIDILVDSSDPKTVMDAFVTLPQVKTVQNHGETKSSILTHDNVQVDLRVVAPESLGAALLYFTGSTGFNVRLRQLALKKSMKVNEYGIFSVKNDKEKLIASKTETDCLKALGLPYVPPELREEIGEARIFSDKGRAVIPALVEIKDIKGDLHVHSVYSDGHNTIPEMAAAARARGYEYVAICDHSQKLRVAGGVSPEDLIKKKKEINAYNEKNTDFRVLYGTEVEIDMDGNLDYNEKILGEFDVVIAAVHGGFDMPPEKMTARLLKACRNKFVHIIAHPTGVHLGKRGPYDFDLKALGKAAREENTFLEINSFPVRLDLNSNNIYFAAGLGANFAINTDSHHIDHLDHMKFGVALARRAWLGRGQVINTLPLAQLIKRLEKT